MARGRRPASGASSDGADSRARILEAAAEELCERGDDGVRMEHVAARAGVNKALVYRWFGDRRNLLRTALARQFEARERVLADLPGDLGEVLVHWHRRNRRDTTFVRLIVREALGAGDADAAEPVHADARRAYYRRQVAMLRRLLGSNGGQSAADAEARGGATRRAKIEEAEDIDAEMLFLALLAVTFMPHALPQIVSLVCGLAPDSRAFTRRWNRMLRRLARLLRT